MRANGTRTGADGPGQKGPGAPNGPMIEERLLHIGGHVLNVAQKRGSDARPPLLLFNGIGANWQLVKPFMEALGDTRVIIFDIPGIGGSSMPLMPYRPAVIARLARKVVEELGHDQVDVAGISWGGTIAQQFAYQYPSVCRRLVLGATAIGTFVIPGNISVLLKMVTPKRYQDRQYMQRIAAEIYGGMFRKDAKIAEQYAGSMHAFNAAAYFYQLVAIAGWTSLPWLWMVRQPTLVLMGEDDPIVPVVNGRVLASLIRKSRLQIIDDGHLFIVTKAEETARIVEHFLSEDRT